MRARIDAWARRLGERRDRRGLVTAAAGGALGLLGVAALGEDAAAKKCKRNRDCPRGEKCRKENQGNDNKGRCR